MVADVNDQIATDLSAEAADEMAKYGIIRVRIDHFLYGDFRYTRLDDAIAEAKRHPGPSKSRLV
jgi:hypothetical protein